VGTGKRKFNSSNRQRMMQGKMLAANISYRIVNVVIVFIINLLLSRMAGVAGYGLLALLIANAGIFNLLSAFGADAGISFHTASGKLAIGKLLSFILVIICFQLVVLVFAEMICWSVSGHLLLFKTYDLQYWWIGPLFLTSISIVEKYSALLNGKQKFTLVNKIIAISNLLTLFVFASLYLIENPGTFHFYISVYVILSFVQALILIITFHAASKESFMISRPQQQDTSAFFSYSLFTFVINIIQFLAYRVDYWLLDHYSGDQELGWYSLAVRLAQL
jgi:O-antigen/teichoic acid export membrane protein